MKRRTHLTEEQVKAIKGNIYSYLSEHGKVKRERLLNHLVFNGFNISDRQMRLIKEEMIMKDNIPVGSSASSGYFIITNDELLKESIKPYQKQCASFAVMVNKLKSLCGKTVSKNSMSSLDEFFKV